jgi:hypothetical protein
MGDYFDDQWLPLSGWEYRWIIQDVLPKASGKSVSVDGDWLYDGTARFGREPYGMTNPREDWSTTWEAYYVNLAYSTNPGVRGIYNYTGMSGKFGLVSAFFAGNF